MKPRHFFFLVGVFFFVSCSSESAKKRYLLAEKLWEEGQYSAAVSEFEKAAAKDPKGKVGLQSLFRAAMTQAHYLSQYAEALKKLKTVADVAGDAEDSWEAKRLMGEIFFSHLEQYEQSIEFYRGLIQEKTAPEDVPEFLFRVAKSHFFLMQFDQALAVFNEVITQFPHSPWTEKAQLEAGTTLFTRGGKKKGDEKENEDYKAAIRAYSLFIQKNPQSPLVPEARFGIASCLEEMDQLEAAQKEYRALLKTYPSPRVVQIKLIRIAERQRQRSKE